MEEETMATNIFHRISDIALRAKSRRDEEYRQFLQFYRELVETVPAEVAKLFGTLNGVKCIVGKGVSADYGIQISATDYLWWKDEFVNKGTRFALPVEQVKAAILTHIAKKAEASGLTADERKELLTLLIDGTP